MIAVIVGLTIVIVSTQTDVLVNEVASSNAEAANVSLRITLDELQEEAKTRAEIIANSSEVSKAIQLSNMYTLKEAVTNIKTGLDLVIVYDRQGNFLVSTVSSADQNTFDNRDDIMETISTMKGISTIVAAPDGNLYTYGSAAIRSSDGQVVGVVVCSHNLALEKYVEKVKERSNCEVSIFNRDIRISTTLFDESGEKPIGKSAPEDVVETVINQRTEYERRINIFNGTYNAVYSPLIVNDEVIGMLYTGVNIDEALYMQRNMITFALIAIIISGAVCVFFIALFSIVAISRPLGKISHFAEKIRMGDLGISSGSDMTIDIRSNDEIGAMAKSLESAFAELKGYVGEIGYRMHGMADGNLTIESIYEFRGDFILIKDSINEIVRKLNPVVRNFKQSASQISLSSTQIADGAKQLAEGTAIQASSVDELSVTIGEILKETSNNASVAKEATNLSGNIRANAEKGDSQMDKLMYSIKEINDASVKINKVIGVIDDIAFQTNILALNAAVEAARAGVHGKGFAVVADEVRDLATKSAAAASDTAKLIADSVEKANLGMKLALETSNSLKEIVEGINRSAEIIAEISQSSDDQANAIAQVNSGIDQVANVVRQNSATAEESAAASEEMSSQSFLLQQMVQHFKVDDNYDE
jgi:methyl-accepting chemotaxis protein